MSVSERASYHDGYERGLREGRQGAAMRQKEADADLVEAAAHDFPVAFSGLDRTLERECLGRLSVAQENAITGAVENFLRSLAAKIRGGA